MCHREDMMKNIPAYTGQKDTMPQIKPQKPWGRHELLFWKLTWNMVGSH